ncbi:unnamed protein product [Haemonchus placei]|uniref:Costars domain-containing protein n=1 Tax=Haemonchus placei TaxID=6290 RepID=A0A0N4WR34_HAEPC|nr:unnamed protein product [Haemonchus placei]
MQHARQKFKPLKKGEFKLYSGETLHNGQIFVVSPHIPE